MRIFFVFLFLFTLNCSSNKVSNNHGFKSLQEKFKKITINKTNKNDMLKIIGPPSSVSNFNKNKWLYIERMKTNQSIFKLGIKKINKNNILIVEFNNKGILKNKKILKLNDMNDIEYVKAITEKDFKQNNILFNILSSLREKANAPTKNRAKNR
ncbi:MAG TPA: outer membrane protein assembly factor BamE [Candidatus Pelagibacter bacterium]|jgi:outer membrane protein assembly factor BamE (lipoprotein component of BamABCDE complex)|nr:outer membrane protein assembly factor BamE [Candidatus Pelagibacter bacterium]|tara:strand:+ start:219 stop:680 length:462 start_codon:yes stop_codon:yes gene_type:complete